MELNHSTYSYKNSPSFNNDFKLHCNIYAYRLLYNDTLYVARTSLPNCDFLGLYAKKSFKQGNIVCKYIGDYKRTVEAIRLQDKSYLMRLGEQTYIDALQHEKVYARYINDCINPMGWNVEFIKDPSLKIASVRALRDIKVNEELFVSYGKKYWLLQKPVKISINQQQQLQNTSDCHNSNVDNNTNVDNTSNIDSNNSYVDNNDSTVDDNNNSNVNDNVDNN